MSLLFGNGEHLGDESLSPTDKVRLCAPSAGACAQSIVKERDPTRLSSELACHDLQMPPAAEKTRPCTLQLNILGSQAKLTQKETERNRAGGHNRALCPGRPLGVLPGVKPSSVFLFKCLTGFCLEIVDRFSIQHISECLPSYFSFHHTVQRKCGGVFTTSIQRLLPSGCSAVKNLPANARDTRDAGSIPGSGRSRGEQNGHPLQ